MDKVEMPDRIEADILALGRQYLAALCKAHGHRPSGRDYWHYLTGSNEATLYAHCERCGRNYEALRKPEPGSAQPECLDADRPDTFEQYSHHSSLVWVRQDLRGRHSDHCLCYSCSKFSPGERDDNCPIANAVYALNVALDITTPVWECPAFEERVE